MAVLLVLVIALDIAAMLWGVDSRDGLASPEWARKQQWGSFL